MQQSGPGPLPDGRAHGNLYRFHLPLVGTAKGVRVEIKYASGIEDVGYGPCSGSCTRISYLHPLSERPSNLSTNSSVDADTTQLTICPAILIQYDFPFIPRYNNIIIIML